MGLVHKVIATESLAFEATLVALRHHFSDRKIRWVHWNLYDPFEREVCPQEGDLDSKEAIVALRHYCFRGLVHSPRLDNLLDVGLHCTMRRRRSGQQEICSVQCSEPMTGRKRPLDESATYLSYWLGERHPRGRSRDAFPKFLPIQLILPPPSDE